MQDLIYKQMLSAGLMMLVAVAAVVWWQRQTRLQWRWFWAGAAIWVAGIVPKLAVGMLLNPFMIGAGGRSPIFGLAGAVLYCGLMTGIFEIGVTFLAGLKWRQLADSPNRAACIGLGAGAFEALVLGFGSLLSCVAAVATGQTGILLKQLTPLAALTPLLWLTGPVERMIAIPTHVAARVWVFQGLAKRSSAGFWIGFAWLSLVDLVAGLALTTGMLQTQSIWWMELMILPFGVLSFPLLRFAFNRWPKAQAPVVLETAAQTK